MIFLTLSFPFFPLLCRRDSKYCRKLLLFHKKMALFHPSDNLSKFIQVTSHVKYAFCTNLHSRNLQVFLEFTSPEDTFLTGQLPALAMSSCADSIPAEHLCLWWVGKHLLWWCLELLWTAAESENRVENGSSVHGLFLIFLSSFSYEGESCLIKYGEIYVELSRSG